MKPEICPVCHGKGTVAPDFYPDVKLKARQKCRACNGKGVIMCHEDWPRPKPIYPWPQPNPWCPDDWKDHVDEWKGLCNSRPI